MVGQPRGIELGIGIAERGTVAVGAAAAFEPAGGAIIEVVTAVGHIAVAIAAGRVGCEYAVGERNRPTDVGDRVASPSGIHKKGAVGDRHSPTDVDDAAAVGLRAVVGKCAVGDRQCAGV